MQYIRIRALVHDKYTTAAKNHVEKGDLNSSKYTTDGKYIYKLIPLEEFNVMVMGAGIKMSELGIDAEFDETYKK